MIFLDDDKDYLTAVKDEDGNPVKDYHVQREWCHHINKSIARAILVDKIGWEKIQYSLGYEIYKDNSYSNTD